MHVHFVAVKAFLYSVIVETKDFTAEETVELRSVSTKCPANPENKVLLPLQQWNSRNLQESEVWC